MHRFDYQKFCEQLKNANLVSSEEEMGSLFGKGTSYVSSRKSKGEEPSLDALTHLAFNLEQEVQEFEGNLRNGTPSQEEWASASILWELQNELFAEIREQVRSSRNSSTPKKL